MKLDPRLAAIVCREDPVLCAEAYGVELAAGISVWRVFKAGTRELRELCRLLGWRLEDNILCRDDYYKVYPLGVAHSIAVHYADGVTGGFTGEALSLARLYLAAPPPAPAIYTATIGYAIGWAVLVSTVDGVASASADGGIPSMLRVLYIHPSSCCPPLRVLVDNEDDAIALAAPLAHRKWRHSISRVVQAASHFVEAPHLFNTGGPVLEVMSASAVNKTPVYARDGRDEVNGVDVDSVEEVWRDATKAAERLLKNGVVA